MNFGKSLFSGCLLDTAYREQSASLFSETSAKLAFVLYLFAVRCSKLLSYYNFELIAH